MHDRDRAGRDARSTRAVRVSPFPPDEIPVPPTQDLGLHEEPAPTPSIELASKADEQCTVRGPKSRSDNLTAKHGNFVSEHDDFDREITLFAPIQTHQLKELGEGQVEKRKSHRPVSSSRPTSRKS
jgi:hypothetical protein